MDYKDIITKIDAKRNPSPDSIHKKSVTGRKIEFSPKLFIAIFLVLIVIVGLVSVNILIKNKNPEKTTDPSASTNLNSSTESGTQTDIQPTNFLFGLTEENKTNLKFLCVMYLNTDGIVIKTIPVNAFSSAENLHNNFHDTYEEGGISDLIKALFGTYGLTANHYIITNEVGLSDIFSYASNPEQIELSFDEDIPYSFNGINMIFEKGTHVMSADLLLKYFCYLADNGKETSEELKDIFVQVFGRIFNGGEKSFTSTMERLINDFNTDISAYDISNYSSTADAMIKSGAFTNITLEDIQNG